MAILQTIKAWFKLHPLSKSLTKEQRIDSILATDFAAEYALPTHLEPDSDDEVMLSITLAKLMGANVISVYRNDAYPNMLFANHNHFNDYVRYLFSIKDNSICYREEMNGTGIGADGRRITQTPVRDAISVDHEQNKFYVNRQLYPDVSNTSNVNKFRRLTLTAVGWRRCLAHGHAVYHESLEALLPAERELLFKHYKPTRPHSPVYLTSVYKSEDFYAIHEHGAVLQNGLTVYLYDKGVDDSEYFVFLDARDAIEYAKIKGASVYGVRKVRLYFNNIAEQHSEEYTAIQKLRDKLPPTILNNIKLI